MKLSAFLYASYQGSIELTKNLLITRNVCKSDRQLDGKIVVITGANSGIGKETAYQLSLRNAKLIIGCRDLKKAFNAINDIKQLNPKADITALKLDLSSLASIREFVEQISHKESKIDILINNAGIAVCPEWQTEDGFEMQFGTNHLGHFQLTLSLLPLLRKSTKARILNVSSNAYIIGKINFKNINLRNGAYSPGSAYAQSKLAIILFTTELAKRLGADSNVNVYGLHPGTIKTDLLRNWSYKSIVEFVFKLFFLNTEQGSQTTLYCALDESLDNETGHYYSDCKRVDNLYSNATDDKSAEKLWELSCDLVKLDDDLKLAK